MLVHGPFHGSSDKAQRLLSEITGAVPFPTDGLGPIGPDAVQQRLIANGVSDAQFPHAS